MALSTAAEGQSLVEVLVAMSVVTVVLLALIAAVVVAIRAVGFGQSKIKATFLAQEAVEWIRNQRSGLGWADFYSLSTSEGTTYCLASLTFDQIGSCTESQTVAGFIREAKLTSLGASKVGVKVTVTWQAEQTFNSEVETNLTEWQIE